MASNTPLLRVLSLGAGVQSTTLALMAAHGEIDMPDCAIFADTQAEPDAVYRHLRWLMSTSILPFPVHMVTAGNLEFQGIGGRPNGKQFNVDIPAFVKTEEKRYVDYEGNNRSAAGSVAAINRSCTRDYKIDPIRRKVRELLGITRRRSPKTPVVEQFIGISLDEAHRMNESREPWVKHRWPLIEKRMTRGDCLEWLKKNGYPKPPKSACIFCPFHGEEQWRSLTAPEMYRAVEFDRRLREHPPNAYRTKGVLYLHRSCKPLSEVDFSSANDRGQPDLFGNECEGMCGV